MSESGATASGNFQPDRSTPLRSTHPPRSLRVRNGKASDRPGRLTPASSHLNTRRTRCKHRCVGAPSGSLSWLSRILIATSRSEFGSPLCFQGCELPGLPHPAPSPPGVSHTLRGLLLRASSRSCFIPQPLTGFPALICKDCRTSPAHRGPRQCPSPSISEETSGACPPKRTALTLNDPAANRCDALGEKEPGLKRTPEWNHRRKPAAGPESPTTNIRNPPSSSHPRPHDLPVKAPPHSRSRLEKDTLPGKLCPLIKCAPQGVHPKPKREGEWTFRHIPKDKPEQHLGSKLSRALERHHSEERQPSRVAP